MRRIAIHRVFPPKIVALSVVWIMVLAAIFAFYKLFLSSAFAVVLLIFISSILVICIAVCLREASFHMIVAPQEAAAVGTPQIRSWAEKRHRTMNIYLSCSLASALWLVLLGIMVIWFNLAGHVVGMFEIGLSCFGLIIVILGIYFSITVSRELRFVFVNREKIIAAICQQIPVR
jgi:hypothetical protein